MSRRSRFRFIAVAILFTAAACRSNPAQLRQEYLKKGDDYAAQGKYTEAIIEYRNALKADPKFGEARYNLAEAYVKTNDVRNALREYVVAADLLPDKVDAQLKAGELLLLAGRFEDAKTRANNALARDSKNVTAQLLKGNATAGLKDIDGAVADVEEAIKLNPDDARSYATLGAMKFSQGSKDEAEAAFKRAVEVEPNSAVVQLALANFMWSTGRAKEVEAPLKRATELQPTNIVAQRALATFYLASGRTAEAEAPLKAVATTSKSIQSRVGLADFYVASKRQDEAVTILKELAAEKDGFGPATIRLATFDFAAKHPAEAYKKVDEVLAKQPKNTDALLLKARFQMAEQKFDEAIAQTRAAIAADPQSAAAQYLLGSLLGVRRDTDGAIEAFGESLKLNPRLLGAKIQLAQLNLMKGAIPTAIEQADDALAAAPNNGIARLTLARALMAKGDTARAGRELDTLIQTFPNFAAAHAQLASLQLIKGDRMAARRELDRALAIEPGSLEALRGRVALDLTEKNTAHARSIVEDRLKESPNNPQLLLLAASTNAALGDVKQQETLLRRVIEVDPANLQAFSDLARLYLLQRRLDEARGEYETLAKRQPKSVAAKTMVALILEAQQKPAEAQKAYEAVLSITPGSPVAANNLAWLYAERGGNLDVALELAQAAKRQMPEVAEVNDTLGWIYYKKDLATLAIEPLQSSIKADPKNPNYYYHLGLAYVKLGDYLKAKEALDEALKRKPDFREADEARKGLGAKG